MAARPNILIFNPDQYRGDVLGHLGNPAAATPNLDRLAADEGVSFSRAFCQNPVCTPSRCSFMSGRYPHVRGHRTMYHMMRPDEPVLLKALKDAGYFVAWFGKNDLVPGQSSFEPYCDLHYQPTGQEVTGMLPGHAEWRGEPDGDRYYSFYVGRREPLGKGPHDFDWACIEKALDFLAQAPKDRPFCLYLPLIYPHPSYGVEEPWYSLIDRKKVPPRIPTPADWTGKPSILAGIHARQNLAGWTEERWTELRATYYGMCARIDHQFGLVLDALRKHGFYDETAVFFFSDHGDFTGDYGLVEKTQNTFEDVLTHVPLLLKPPAGVPLKVGVREALVELVDVSATIETLTGLTPEHTGFGRSLLPLAAGETDEHRDAVFCEGGRVKGEEHCAEKESKGADDSTNLYWPRVNLQARLPEHTKAVMCRTPRYKYVRRLYERDELYDLERDPGEQENRLADPQLADVLTQLKERLLTFLLETADVVPHKPDRR